MEIKQEPEEVLLQQAYHDGLTGLPNRQLFDDRLRQAIQRAQHSDQTLCIFALDLDNFKNINHLYGHSTGDSLLQLAARRMSIALGPHDVLARLGADEFLLLTHATPDAAKRTAKELSDSLRMPFTCNGQELFTTVSIGLSIFPHDALDAESLLRNAEAALDRAKQDGKNATQLYTSTMTSSAVKRVTLENSLRRALQRQEFVIHYQPQVDLKTGQIVAAEALVRWQVPGLGLVPPAEFIPIAEETGLIIPIGEWVLQTACFQNQLWKRSGLPAIRVAVNLSARQFHQEGLIDSVKNILRTTGMDPQQLELEITESYAMKDADFAITVLRELQKRAVRLSIDDFGTGYSSLSYLRQFPINTLKIDRSFVKELATDPGDAAICEAIIGLAHSLKLDVVAEGVETEAELAILRRQRCDKMQGYYFSKPVPADALEKLLQEGKKLKTE